MRTIRVVFPFALVLASLSPSVPMAAALPAFFIGIHWLAFRFLRFLPGSIFASRKEPEQFYRIVKTKVIKGVDGKVTSVNLVEKIGKGG